MILAQLNKFKGDVSVMTYTGHVVHYTLIRCRFSPLATTGQVISSNNISFSLLNI